MNTDQQLLYSIYSEKGREASTPNVELQLYISERTRKSLVLFGISLSEGNYKDKIIRELYFMHINEFLVVFMCFTFLSYNSRLADYEIRYDQTLLNSKTRTNTKKL